MVMINYKQLFIRFLKEKKLYEKWLNKIRKGSWKHSISNIFTFIPPPHFISRTINEYFYDEEYRYNKEEYFREFVNADFEWRVLCYEINNEYLLYLKKFINSRYFSYDVNIGALKQKYSYLEEKKEIPII